MANGVMIQLGTGGSYRITCGDDHSEEVPLGESIEWNAPNGKTYLTFCDLEAGAEESDTVESMFEHYVYEVKPIPTADVMTEEFEEEGGEGDDDDEGDGTDGDDPDEPVV
jgi:hypothetical protein